MKKAIKKVLGGLGIEVIVHKKKSKKSSKLKLHDTASGKYYLPEEAHEDIVANTIIANGIFDSEIVDWARKFITPGSTALDIGANYGQMTVLFSKMVGENGKVFSFEADDFIFDVLSKNIAVNNCLNVTPVFGAVHNVADEVLVFPEQDFERFGTYGSYGIDYNKTKTGREVRTLTIDGLKLEDKISFIKIDVQGGDLFALQGAVETIKKNKMPILFEFEYLFQDDMHLDFQEYVDFVQTIGYKFERVINGQNYLIVPKK